MKIKIYNFFTLLITLLIKNFVMNFEDQMTL